MDTPLFAYGSLLDEDIASLVCCQPLSQLQCVDASLFGFKVCYVEQQTFPALRKQPGAVAEGKLIYGLNAASWAAIKRYETELYELYEGVVSLSNVSLDEPNAPLIACYFSLVYPELISDEAWTLSQWQREHKAAFLQIIQAEVAP